MQVLNNECLKEYTNYKIGGDTPKLYILDKVKDLYEIPSEDLKNAYILGGGTNILVSDNGVDYPVIKINFKGYTIDTSNSTMNVEAGMDLNDLCKELINREYKGLIHVAGIPGTIGGAIIMNASASHGAISDTLISVEAYNKETRETKIFIKSECDFGFRHSIFQNSPWIIISARFNLEHGDIEELMATYHKIIDYRNTNYPTILPSAGCWFKRDWGGKDIIEKIGMVGACKGGAVVSKMFPAFIMNIGNATASDVYFLVKEIQDKAMKIGEDMPFEVDIWGSI
jgi:UDP-N-acetylmuramate dehydrogenase